MAAYPAPALSVAENWAASYSDLMATLTIDRDDEALHQIEQAAQKDGSTVASWAGRQLAAASRLPSGWPDQYFETIASFGPTDLEEPPEVANPLDDPFRG